MSTPIKQLKFPQVFLMNQLSLLLRVLLSVDSHLEESGWKCPSCLKFRFWEGPDFFVRNRGNGERREGGGIIQDEPGVSGVYEAHVEVGYSAEITLKRGVILSEAAANASTCFNQDSNSMHSTYKRREILNMCDKACALGYDYDGNIGPFYYVTEE